MAAFVYSLTMSFARDGRMLPSRDSYFIELSESAVFDDIKREIII